MDGTDEHAYCGWQAQVMFHLTKSARDIYGILAGKIKPNATIGTIIIKWQRSNTNLYPLPCSYPRAGEPLRSLYGITKAIHRDPRSAFDEKCEVSSTTTRQGHNEELDKIKIKGG